MNNSDFLKDKYSEVNYLKSILRTYPKEYKETIIKVLNLVMDEIADFLDVQRKESLYQEEVKDMTVEELAKFDGREGRAAYIALGNIIYDVTEVSMWKNGNHFGVLAGRVLDGVIEQGHKNYKEILNSLPVVGRVVCENEKRDHLTTFRIEEITKYDGKNGRSAYVVVEGTVYDVTNIKPWINGKHYGIRAGKDVTKYFNTCHNNQREFLEKLRIVGTIIE